MIAQTRPPPPEEEMLTYGLSLHGLDGLETVGELQAQHPGRLRLPRRHEPS